MYHMYLINLLSSKKIIKKLHKIKTEKSTFESLSLIEKYESSILRKRLKKSTYLTKITFLFKTRNYELALETIKLLENEPQHARLLKKKEKHTLLYIKSSIELLIGSSELAEKYARELYELDPQRERNIIHYAKCLYLNKKINQAIDLLSTGKDKDSIRIWLFKHLIYNEINHPNALDLPRQKDIKQNPDLHLISANIFSRKKTFEEQKKFITTFFESFCIPAPTWEDKNPSLENLICRNYSKIDRNPLISVIMTTFNSESTISYAIESILNQSYKNLEIFIVDDVSSDNTIEIIESYATKDSRINLIKNKHNIGTYSSKNIAITRSSGEYITFHDSDDWHHPLRIEYQHKDLEDNPKLMGIYTGWIRATHDLVFIIKPSLGILHPNLSSLLIRREVINQIGYYDSVRISADSEFIARAKTHFSEKSIKYWPIPLAIGLYHTNSLTTAGAGAFDSFRPSIYRAQYWNDFSKWHLDSYINKSKLYIDFPQQNRPFNVNAELLP